MNDWYRGFKRMGQAGLLIGAAALVAGCGGGDGDITATTPTTTTTPAPTTLKANVQAAYDAYASSSTGQLVALQGKMATPNVYLADVARGTDKTGATPAAYWYVRNGVHDDGVSLAPEAVLYTNLQNLKAKNAIQDFNFRLVMNLNHSENVSTDEAFAWMDSIRTAAGASAHTPAGTTGWWDVTKYPTATGPTTDASGTITGVSALTTPAVTGKEVLTVTLDGTPFNVTHYWGSYAGKPNAAAQMINIYVPQNVTANSAVYFRTNNSGWVQNPNRATLTNGQVLTTGRLAYNTVLTGNNGTVLGEVLNRGMVLVSYGARTRADAATNGQYLGHSPATMTDTKAAIRFVKYNMVKGSLPGDPNRIIITGMSGGGGLTSIIAASGNSSDYFPSLAAIGALGITTNSGVNSSDAGVGDDVWATFSSAPIIDLFKADYAMEWMYNPTRQKVAAGVYASATGFSASTSRYKKDYLADWQNLGSNVLGQNGYPDYIASLGMTTTGVKRTLLDMVQTAMQQVVNANRSYSGPLTGITDAASATATLKTLLRNSYGSWGVDSLGNPTTYTQNPLAPGFAGLPLDWFTVTGTPGKFTVTIADSAWDAFCEYMYWTAQWVKNPPGSDNIGLSTAGYVGTFNENNLWGAAADAFGHTNPVSFAMDASNWSLFGITPSTSSSTATALSANQALAKSLYNP